MICARHNCLVCTRRLARNLWRQTYWVLCIYCNELWGHYPTQKAAWARADEMNDASDRALDALLDAGKLTGREKDNT